MPVLRNKWTPLQIVITNGYTCSLFQVAKIARKTEITKKGRCVKKRRGAFWHTFVFRRFDSRLDRWGKIISTMTTKIANILQCYALGMEIKQISRSFELSCNTVHKYVRLFQKCGIPIKELASMPSSRIQEMFSEGISRSQIPSQRQLELEALLP